MDRKTLGAVVACLLLFFFWGPLVNRIWPPIELTPEQLAEQQAAEARLGAVTNKAGISNISPLTDVVTEVPETTSLTGGGEDVAPATTETVENSELRLTFTSRAGGIERIELKEFPRYVTRRGRDVDVPAALNEGAVLPVLSLGDDRNDYALSATGNELTATTTWANGLVVTKKFTLSTNYLIHASVTITNPTDAAVSLPRHQWTVGTSTPSGSNLDARFTGILWFDGADKEMIADSWFQNRLLGCIPREPRSVYRGGQGNVVWGGVQNQFFTIVTVPDEPAEEIVARQVALPEPTAADLEAHPRQPLVRRGHQAALVYDTMVIPAGGAMERNFEVFAGPKEYNLLSSLSLEDGLAGLDLVMNFSGFFGFFAKLLLLSMNALHNMTGLGYGIAIVAITIIIRLVFWPLTTASTRSMKRMAKLQPQMKAIQEKYKDDPQKMQKETLKFMRENKVNPLGSCLPMLLQLPVFFGFFTMLQSAIELRGASFLWIIDLSQPDTLFNLPGIGLPFNLMPLIMGGTMLYQARLTPMSPGMDPAQQKIMRYMPLMFMVFLYNMSAGLTLYWSVSNVMSIAQTKLTRLNDEKESATPGPGARPAAALPSSGRKARKKRDNRAR